MGLQNTYYYFGYIYFIFWGVGIFLTFAQSIIFESIIL